MWVALGLLLSIAVAIFTGELSANRRHSEIMIDAARRDTAATLYQATLIDVQARINKESTRNRWIERAIDTGKLAPMDQETAEAFMETIDAYRAKPESDPDPK